MTDVIVTAGWIFGGPLAHRFEEMGGSALVAECAVAPSAQLNSLTEAIVEPTVATREALAQRSLE